MVKNIFLPKNSSKNRQEKNFVSLLRDYYIYAGFILAIVLVSSLWSAIALYKSQKKSLQDQLTSEAQLIDASLGNYLKYVSHIAEDKGHKIALNKGNLKYVSDLFKRNFFFSVTKSGLKRKAFLWPHFSWIDKDGNVRVKSEIGVLSKPQKARDGKDLYQSTINSWQLNVSDPYYDELENKAFIDASLGVSDLENEKYIGAISTRFNIEKLTDVIKSDLKDDTKFIVLNDEFKIIIGSENNKINDDFFSARLAEMDHDSDLVVLKDQIKYQGNSYYVYKKSADYPFIILTGYNSGSAKKEFTINLVERFFAIFGGVFFIAVILFFQRKRIINQEKENKRLLEEKNSELTELNIKLGHQNELAKKSKKSHDKFLLQTKQDIIESAVMNIAKDIAKIIDAEDNNIIMTQKAISDLHKKILESCAKLLSYVSDNLNFCSVDARRIINEAIDLVNYDAAIKNVELISEIAGNVSEIYVDERSIKHVIMSLISYAMEDRKRENTFVIIKANNKNENEQRFVEVIIEDNGHGISEEMRINFAENAEKEGNKENNTSLTLQAIRAILAAHNATLNIDNTMGIGSVITIQIPCGSSNDLEKENFENNTNHNNIIELFPKKP